MDVISSVPFFFFFAFSIWYPVSTVFSSSYFQSTSLKVIWTLFLPAMHSLNSFGSQPILGSNGFLHSHTHKDERKKVRLRRQRGNDSSYAVLFTDTQRPAQVPLIKLYSCFFLIILKILSDLGNSGSFVFSLYTKQSLVKSLVYES